MHAVAATSDGYALRFSLEPFVEPSTRAGRRFARVPEAAVVGVERYTGDEILIAATARRARDPDEGRQGQPTGFHVRPEKPSS